MRVQPLPAVLAFILGGSMVGALATATHYSPPEPPSSPAATSTPVPTVTVTSQPKETLPSPCETALEIASTLDDALNGYQGDLQKTNEIQVKSGEAIYLKDN